ncbi:hypothetical protein BDQ17DRAFT_25408 [Cyathus striatus]|nr:hypothetical protein BDQ17DRAFT_25408 [Cyathus striatus]
MRDQIITAVKQAPPRSLNVVIDAVDILASDIGSLSETYKFLKELLRVVHKHSQDSRLILHLLRPSPLIHLLTETRFSPSLTLVTAHPPVLLTHIATEYLTPPPPASHEAKFWSIFLPISERGYDIEQLVFGGQGRGCGDPDEFVAEVVVRSAEGGRKRAVERVLEGWSSADGPCDLTTLSSLKSLRLKALVAQPTSDPTQNVSFNLTLTVSQQESRAQVPLPYAHEGKPLSLTNNQAGAIFYDPDSADDIDDDDPDEDLDI